MPIPTPKKDEKRNKYISRCMEAIKGEDRPQKQKLAICYQKWKKRK